MNNKQLSRRDFIKITGAVAGGVAATQFIPPPVARAARLSDEFPTDGSGYISTMCEMCVWRCGVRAKVVDGRVVKLEGNPDHPHSGGKLCARGQSGLMTTYDPDRVLTPLIRTGKRGEGLFRKASWDEALDIVAEKMLEIKKKYGPEAMVFSSTHNLSQPLFENILYGFGSPNYGTQRSLCFNAMINAHLLTYGIEEPSRNYDNVKFVLLVGRNMLEAISTSETSAMMEAHARGAKIVYLDPRFTKTAALADEWYPIRPGTDSAFLLAMLNVIVTNNLLAGNGAAEYILGYDKLPDAVKDYTPQWAAPITGVDAKVIERVAREFAAAAPEAMVHPGWRTSNFINSYQTERTIATINALSGNIAKPDGCLSVKTAAEGAGLANPPQPPYPRISAQRLDGIPYKYPLVPFKIGVFQEMRDAMLSGKPYQAHGMFVSRQNPVLSLPDRKKTLQALGKLDFIAVVDIILNDTSWFADVVLPESSYLERFDPLLPVGDKVFIRQPVVETMGDTHSAIWIYKQLGERIGLKDFFQYKDEEDYIKQQIAPLHAGLDELRQKGFIALPPSEEKPAEKFTLNTPSGKVEVYSETLQKA
ncbi:MAG: molybdopterin-dependent oxidoreductase, partial [Chloroflexota bacterium]